MSPVDSEEREAPLNYQVQHSASATLLPAPIAGTISLVTRSTALYLRLGTLIGALALDSARVTTLTGLELSRAIIEGILSRAGRDVTERSKGELGRVEAEGMLERSIATLHHTITRISFAASTGFHISTTALASAADLSQHLLLMLDAIVGSTDSSRAIASIITLIRREFENPATGQPGEKVSVSDLLIGICGLALLQRWCKRLTDLEAKEKKHNDIVCWDVVILDDGRRGDVVGSAGESGALSMKVSGTDKGGPSNMLPSMTTTGGDEVLQTVERPDTVTSDDEDDEWPEISLKGRLMNSLPLEASLSITTETEITKTITVEIMGAQPPDLSPPPGVEIVEENSHVVSKADLNNETLTNEQKIALLVPRCRIVYRTIRNKVRGSSIKASGSPPDANEASAHETVGLPLELEPSKHTTVAKNISEPFDFDGQRSITSLDRVPFSLSPLPSPKREPITEIDVISRNALEILGSQYDRRKGSVGLRATPSPTQAQAANQKRPRKQVISISGSDGPHTRLPVSVKSPAPKKIKPEILDKKATDKKGAIKNVFRKGSSVTLAGIWSKDQQAAGQNLTGGLKIKQSSTSNEVRVSQTRPPWSTHKSASEKPMSSHIAVAQRGSSVVPARDAPHAPQRGNPNYFSSHDLGLLNMNLPTSPSIASYYSVHERERDSLVSQTDTYSIRSNESRPPSPTAFRTHLRTQSKILRARSEKNMNIVPESPRKNHRRSRSYVPSIYTLGTNNSETSLVIEGKPRKGVYEEAGSLQQLASTGHIDGLFPKHHMVRNVARFIRFASASYGASFMRIMGIGTASGISAAGIDAEHHFEHHSFSQHTQLPPSTILLSSFVDPQGGTDSTGQTDTGIPMVHFVSLDHESKAVVLSCRGTLGFEDVLTDMTCDYDELLLNGRAYKVHKGIYASALRLLSGKGSRVLATLAAALEEFPDYGLVMCGHSLGGGVTALLAIIISEPNSSNTAFITASECNRPQLLFTSSDSALDSAPGSAPLTRVHLPPGRSIHVYAYGPPATMSPSLRLVTRGLITTIINGQDLVPYLSLGVLHDLQAVALAFKNDDSGAKGEVRARVWAGLASGFTDKWYAGRPSAQPSDDDDQWAYSALKTLRVSMLSAKLVPPGEVFCVETTPVLQRDAFMCGEGSAYGARGLGRPATRAVLKYVRHVEKRFGELRFGGSMLLDHSPGRYESSLAALAKGVLTSYS